MVNTIRKYIIMTIILITSSLLLTGCTEKFLDKTKNNNIVNTSETNNNVSKLKNEETSLLEDFITKYNELESIPISNCVDFTANDKNGEYYRTEFRLLTFKNAKSKHGQIGDSTIDMIDYSSELGTMKYKQFRIYISSKDFNNAKEIATSSIKILDSSISDDDIQNIFNSMPSSFTLGKYIKGTFTKGEIMIDFIKNI